MILNLRCEDQKVAEHRIKLTIRMATMVKTMEDQIRVGPKMNKDKTISCKLYCFYAKSLNQMN